MKILAVTSGKGGVGKSTLSLNIARQLTLAGKCVLLIDFDIHNKGISGLFLEKIEPETTSVNEIAARSEGFASETATTLADVVRPIQVLPKGQMFLIPALVPRAAFEWKNFTGDNANIVSFFRQYLTAVAGKLHIDVVLIDCYGGVDSLTVAAAGIADDVIVVNEPDLITFTGTLLLYDYFKTVYPGAEDIRVHFVINRVTLRHSFDFLNAEYREHLAPLTPDQSILAYLPFDQHVVDTFGEYPFHSELMPTGIFARKIRLLIQRLWKNDEEYAKFSRLSNRRAGKVFRATTELRFAQPERIIVAVVSLPGWLVLPLLMLFALFQGLGHTLPYDVIVATFYTACLAILCLVLLIGVVEPFLMSAWLHREARFKRRRSILTSTQKTRSYFAYAGRNIAAALPALFSGLLLAGMVVLMIEASTDQHYWNSSGRLVNLSIWSGEVSHLHRGGNYSWLQLNQWSDIRAGQDLSNTNFRNARLNGHVFRKLNLSGARFTYALLENTQFIDCDLRGANFDGANMFSAQFVGGNLSRAQFHKANLPKARFVDTDLTAADFTGSSMLDTSFSGPSLKAAGAIFRDVSSLPSGDSLQALLKSGVTDLAALQQATNEAQDNSSVISDSDDVPVTLVTGAFYLLEGQIEAALAEGTPDDLALARQELPKFRSYFPAPGNSQNKQPSVEPKRAAEGSGKNSPKPPGSSGTNERRLHQLFAKEPPGVELLLELLLAVRSVQDDRAQATALELWVRKNGPLSAWDWTYWDSQVQAKGIPPERQKKFHLIQQLAEGTMTADKFHRAYFEAEK